MKKQIDITDSISHEAVTLLVEYLLCNDLY